MVEAGNQRGIETQRHRDTATERNAPRVNRPNELRIGTGEQLLEKRLDIRTERSDHVPETETETETETGRSTDKDTARHRQPQSHEAMDVTEICQ